MASRALAVIDLQNDITKNYREIIDTTNRAIDWAVADGISRFFMGRIAKTLGCRDRLDARPYESGGTGKSSMACFAGLCYDEST